MIKLESNFGEIPWESFGFPGGEIQVRVNPNRNTHLLLDWIRITAHIYSSDDLMQLLLTVNAIRQQVPFCKIDLVMPYFPYARQDRVCSNGEAFSAKMIADMINALGFHSVTVWDAHSAVVPALLDRCVNVPASHFVERLIVTNGHWEPPYGTLLQFVCPDNGARKRVDECATKFDQQVLYCEKRRDPRTGKITAMEVPLDGYVGPAVIIDDICDGGRTFVEIAKKLRCAMPKRKIYLYVTHGIFSNGWGEHSELGQVIDRIYTPNPWPGTEYGGIVVKI